MASLANMYPHYPLNVHTQYCIHIWDPNGINRDCKRQSSDPSMCCNKDYYLYIRAAKQEVLLLVWNGGEFLMTMFYKIKKSCRTEVVTMDSGILLSIVMWTFYEVKIVNNADTHIVVAVLELIEMDFQKRGSYKLLSVGIMSSWL